MSLQEKKLCPFAQGEDAVCYGESCGCFVTINKPNILRFIGSEFIDPEHYLFYKGCGLIQHIPWQLKEREKPAPKTETEKQAEEAYAKLEAHQ